MGLRKVLCECGSGYERRFCSHRSGVLVEPREVVLRNGKPVDSRTGRRVKDKAKSRSRW